VCHRFLLKALMKSEGDEISSGFLPHESDKMQHKTTRLADLRHSMLQYV
jgi:hypothetical protein